MRSAAAACAAASSSRSPDQYSADELPLLAMPQTAWRSISQPGPRRGFGFLLHYRRALIKFCESPRGYMRGFCGDCGSPIINRAGPTGQCQRHFPWPSPQYGIPLALLDDPPVRPELHCFVASKAPWFEITDDLPQYSEYPPPG